MKKIRKMWEVMTDMGSQVETARIKMKLKKEMLKRLLKVKIKTKILKRVMGRLLITAQK